MLEESKLSHEAVPVNGKLFLKKIQINDNVKLYAIMLQINYIGRVSIPLLTIAYDFKEKTLADAPHIPGLELNLEDFKEPETIEDVLNYAKLLEKEGRLGIVYPRNYDKSIKIVEILLQG